MTVLIRVENGSEIENGGWQNGSRRSVKTANLFFPRSGGKERDLHSRTEAHSANFEWQSEANKHVTGFNSALSLVKVRDQEHGPIRPLLDTYQEAVARPITRQRRRLQWRMSQSEESESLSPLAVNGLVYEVQGLLRLASDESR